MRQLGSQMLRQSGIQGVSQSGTSGSLTVRHFRHFRHFRQSGSHALQDRREEGGFCITRGNHWNCSALLLFPAIPCRAAFLIRGELLYSLLSTAYWWECGGGGGGGGIYPGNLNKWLFLASKYLIILFGH